MLNREEKVQVSDTTMLNNHSIAGDKNNLRGYTTFDVTVDLLLIRTNF